MVMQGKVHRSWESGSMITSIGAELNSPCSRNLAQQGLQALTTCGPGKRYNKTCGDTVSLVRSAFDSRRMRYRLMGNGCGQAARRGIGS